LLGGLIGGSSQQARIQSEKKKQERRRRMAIAAPGQLNLNESPSWGSRSVDCFEKLEQIGEGTYGSVSQFSLVSLCFCVF